MYKIKTMALTCAMMLCGLSAAAQFSTGSSSTTTETADYNQVGISYVNESFSFDYPKDYDKENVGLNGFGLKYIHGFSVSKSLPMYIETGLSFNFKFGSNDIVYDDDYSIKEKYQHAALSVPVNFAYKFNINENFAVKPYLGLNFKFNILGRMKYEAGEDYDDEDYDYWRSVPGSRAGYDDWDDWDDDEYMAGDKWINLFDKKEMGDAPWNRFQMGWQIGADVQFKKFFLGLEYGTDFIKAQSKKVYGEKLNVNSGTFKVTLGFCF